MAEYIERKKLEEAFDNADPDICESYPDGYSDWGFGRENVRDVIKGVPAADVAPVVRCKDCKYGCKDGNGRSCEGYWYELSEYDVTVKDDDFCSYGERKDGGKDG